MSALTNPGSTARAAAPGIVFLARLGYAAKGVVFIVIGALAARLAAGTGGGGTTDQRGALRFIGNGPLGTLALLVIGIGLLGYMLWRFVAAATDAEGKGHDPTSILQRIAQAGRGLVYGLLGIQTLRALASRGGGPTGESGQQAQTWTARLLELPLGRALVFIGAASLLGYAGYQLYRASSDEKVRRHLDFGRMSADRARMIVRFGQFGIAARAVVFALLALFVFRAAREVNAREVGGVSKSLATLANAPYGRLALGVVALGLIAYGAYQLATARYRRMRAM